MIATFDGSDDALWPRVPDLIAELRAAREQMDRRIPGVGRELLTVARGLDACRRLLRLHGISRETASAALTAIGIGVTVDRGPDLSACLVLASREDCSGGRRRLGRITKHGNRCLPTLPVSSFSPLLIISRARAREEPHSSLAA